MVPADVDVGSRRETSSGEISLESVLQRSEVFAAESSAVADVFDELLRTEEAYVADLNTMVTVYSRPAQKLALGQLLTPEDNTKIFANIEQLLQWCEGEGEGPADGRGRASGQGLGLASGPEFQLQLRSGSGLRRR